jgi:hypothetical protein
MRSSLEKALSNCFVPISIADIPFTPGAIDPYWGMKQETDMYAKQEISTERDESLEYIRSRVRDIYYEKCRDIEKHFSDPDPKSFKEAQEWLKTGNFRVQKPSWLEDCDDDTETYANFFHWGKTPIDQKKKTAAQEALETAKTLVKDTCSIVTDEQTRLKALQDFESSTFY